MSPQAASNSVPSGTVSASLVEEGRFLLSEIMEEEPTLSMLARRGSIEEDRHLNGSVLGCFQWKGCQQSLAFPRKDTFICA